MLVFIHVAILGFFLFLSCFMWYANAFEKQFSYHDKIIKNRINCDKIFMTCFFVEFNLF